jgi:predicted MFS family arabinose efflux permease
VKRGQRSGVLADRDFRLLFIGQGLSAFGDTAATIAVAFAVFAIGGSAGALGIALAARYVPLAGFLLVGGVVADRLPRRRIMLASDTVRAVTQGVLALLLLSGSAHLWQIVVLQALYGTAEAFFTPSVTGLVPELVEHSRLHEANSLLRTTFSLSLVIGPALGGLLVLRTGPEGAIVVDAATFAVSAMLLSQLRSTPRPSHTTAPLRLLADLKEGWSEVRSRPWLSLTIGNATLFNALAVPAIVVLGPELAQSELGGVGAWSIIVAAVGAGSVVGSVASLRVRAARPAAAVAVLLAIAGSEPAALASGLRLPVIVAFCFVAGMAMAMAGVTWISMLQRHVPGTSLSRVNSIDDFMTFLLLPIGYLLAGPLADALGPHQAMALLTAIPLAASLATLTSSQVRRLGWTQRAAMTPMG